MYVCLLSALLGDGVESHGSGATDSCEPPCGGLGLSAGPVEEQQFLASGSAVQLKGPSSQERSLRDP